MPSTITAKCLQNVRFTFQNALIWEKAIVHCWPMRKTFLEET